MTKYESRKLLQFVDAVTAEKAPSQELLEETVDIIGRMLMFSGHPELTVASMDLIRLAKAYGLEEIPRPAFSMQILQDIFALEQKKAVRRIKQ